MKMTTTKKIAILSGMIFGLSAWSTNGQETELAPSKPVNFGYSQNPKTRTKKESERQTPQTTGSTEATPSNVETRSQLAESIAKKTLEVVKTASKKALAPTEHYRVGIGDVLLINLQNSSKSSTYYTVLNDGTIDYPLAGEMILVAGLTTDEIEGILTEKIKLYENPRVSVNVRDYSSHKITVLGLVEKSGDKYLQREAVPLFVVRAEAIVQPNAGRVVIRRAETSTETFSLTDEKAQEVLIFPGDIVEFAAEESSSVGKKPKFFFIGGAVVAGGQKEFFEGMTLTQAILASGGLRKEGTKRVIVRRQNENGLLVSTEFNLKAIKDGKFPDPVLRAGDTIEVGL